MRIKHEAIIHSVALSSLSRNNLRSRKSASSFNPVVSLYASLPRLHALKVVKRKENIG